MWAMAVFLGAGGCHAVGPVLADRGDGLPDGLRVEVGAHAPVGQPNGDDGARLAVGGDDLRDLGGVEDDGALERAGVQDGLGHGGQCSCLIAGISRTPPRS